MPPVSFWRDTVTVARAPLVDRRGSQARDWSQATPHDIPGCHAQPAEGYTSFTASGQPVVVRMRLWLPPGSDIQAGDRVTVCGEDYAIDGAPAVRTSPTGAVSHVEVRLVDWR